ncbi:pilus assembly protein PilM, partial [bacterium]|nr:pilus assembly protein PilM [bacterium]
MAGAKRCIGLDLGSHSVKLAEMAIDRGGIRIVRMLSAPVTVGPDALEDERNAAIVAAVRGLIKEHKIPTRRAVFGMPGHTVFFRRIRLPRAPGPRLRQIVHFEARQLIPFPLEKTMVEFQVFDTEEEREVEVLLVAMKKETNQEFMRLIRRIGLRPIGITASTLALFNGQEIHRFNVKEWEEKSQSKGLLAFGKAGPKKAKKKKAKKGEEEPEEPVEEEIDEDIEMMAGGGFEEVRAYVNIGARTTELAICKGGGSETIGFIRPIPLGGNHVTAAIMKACKTDTFTQAEQIKLQQAACLSGIYEIEADTEKFNAEACQAATKVCDRLVAELRRSLDYFISQPDGVAVDLIVLSGGAAEMAFLASYIEERLGLPVETPRALGNGQIKTPSQYGEDFDYSPYRIAVGLAAQGLGISPVHVDFLPADIRATRDVSSQYAELAALAGVIGVMIFLSAQLGSGAEQNYRRIIDTLPQQVEQRETERRNLDEANRQRDRVTEKTQLLAQQLSAKDYWLDLMLQIQNIKPAGMLLTQVTCQPDRENPKIGQITIRGEAEQQAAITNFVRYLPQQSPMITNASLAILEQGRSTYFNKQISQFQLLLRVRTPQGRGRAVLTRLPRPPEIEHQAEPER